MIFVRNRYQNIWAVDTPSHLDFECSYIIQLSIQHTTTFNTAFLTSPPLGGVIVFIIAMNQIFKDDLQKELSACPLQYLLCTCV